MNHLSLCLLLVSALSFSACTDDPIVPEERDYSTAITTTAEDVILHTYQELADRGAILRAAGAQLEAQRTAESLEFARSAWRAAREPWEQSEGFLFGPVDQEGLDPSIDSWPVNVTDLNNILSSSGAISVGFLQAQEGTLKGFHTIEFLLWGESGDKTVDQLTPRQFEYLAAATAVLAEDTRKLFGLWAPSGENFIANVITAGNGSRVYRSQKAAIEEFANALVVIADEVANGKINDPFAAKDLKLEESRFSANSKADFADNMRSVRNIYLASMTSSAGASSLSAIVARQNSTLDAEIRAEIEASIARIESIPGTFSTAVFQQEAAVRAAQEQVRSLQTTLESKLLPLISSL